MRIIQREMHPPELGGGGGMRRRTSTMAKRIVRKLTHWYVEPRWTVQNDLNSQTIEFASLMYNFAYNNVRRLDTELDELRRQNTRLKLQLVDASERVSRCRGELKDLNEIVSFQRTLLQGVAGQDEVRALSKEITSLLDRLGAAGVSGVDIDYVEFESRFRGNAAELEQSQRRYVSLFPEPAAPGRIVDIGCGRGEMLALLQNEGHEVLGVDLDAGMVEVCNSKGLPAILDDGIHFLSQTPPDSLKGVFCAQVVEHLLTPELEQLIRLAFRALWNDGVLVIETINPRSSFALGNHFYADTSHVRPVHPETLRFICEQIGFAKVQLEERSPHPSLELVAELPEGSVGKAVGTLLENVFGYQDYVIVATK
jgi:O-antigen chain-terminating methyltransferase